MTARTYRARDGLTVTALPIHDDLASVLRVADWIHTNGGRLTDPMTTFDCVFRLYVGAEAKPVNVGDWVIRHPDGGFTVAPDDEFANVFEEVAP